MKRWAWVSFTAMASLVFFAMIACDSGSNDSGGAADANSGSGYSLSTFAGKWKVFYVDGGYAGHTITLAADGTIIAQAEEECARAVEPAAAVFTSPPVVTWSPRMPG